MSFRVLTSSRSSPLMVVPHITHHGLGTGVVPPDTSLSRRSRAADESCRDPETGRGGAVFPADVVSQVVREDASSLVGVFPGDDGMCLHPRPRPLAWEEYFRESAPVSG